MFDINGGGSPLPPPPEMTCQWRDASESAGGRPVWTAIPSVTLAETVSGLPPTQATRAWAAWNSRDWMLHFDMDDARPWATLTERDGPLWKEEVVEVFFDPAGDGQSYFEIEINPLGTVCDLVLRRVASGWRKEFGWHAAGMTGSASMRPGGWTAEMSIPFASLGPAAQPFPGAVWRVNFFRIDRSDGAPDTTAELSAWSPTGLRNFHCPDRFGRMRFALGG